MGAVDQFTILLLMIFLTHSNFNLKMYMQLPLCILEAFTILKTTKTPLRNLQRPPRLQDDAMVTNRRGTTSQEGRDLKIDM